MNPPNPMSPYSTHSALHIRLDDRTAASIKSKATAVGLTSTEWARHQLVLAVGASDPPPQVGPQHVLLLLQEILALRDIVVDLIAAKPLSPEEYQRILNEIDAQKTMGAQGMLAGLSANRSLPFPKG